MKKRVFTLAMLLLALAQTSHAAPAPPQTAQKLQAMLDTHRATGSGIRSEALFVRTSTWQWSGATGMADGAARPMTPRHVFRIASVTKPYTAAAILRLMEMGRIDIAQPISTLISGQSADALRGDGYDPTRITVQHLLAHTSGIYDYAEDGKYVERVMSDPAHQWTRIEQINHAMTYGQPIDAPGGTYAYSDTGYVLLGEIIERQTGMSLARGVRSLVRFDRLGLRNTYWEQLEPKTGNAPFARHYFGATDMTNANPSLDLFGGGGLISNVEDLSKFYRALVRGEVFDSRHMLAVMMSVSDAKRESGVHNNALTLVKVGRYQCWGHGGFWGQLVVHCPENDLTFAWTFNQAELSRESMTAFVTELASVVAP
jgi:D-alanyl-D-alanine carboxypeptidase